MKSKTHILLTGLAALSIAVSSSFAGAGVGETRAKMYAVADVNLAQYPKIEEGVSPSALRFSVGGPARELTPNLWVYTQFRPTSDMARADRCDQLVVAFEDKRVSEMYFVNDEALEIIRNRIKQGNKSHEIVLAAVTPTDGFEVASNN